MKSILSLALCVTLTSTIQAQTCCNHGMKGAGRFPANAVPPSLARTPVSWPMTPFNWNYFYPTPNPTAYSYPTPYWPQPITSAQAALKPLAASTTASTTNPLAKPGTPSSDRPITSTSIEPDRYLQRSSDEKNKYVRDALKRGYQAELDGNLGLARACYENACTIYPDAAQVDRAKASLERLRQR